MVLLQTACYHSEKQRKQPFPCGRLHMDVRLWGFKKGEACCRCRLGRMHDNYWERQALCHPLVLSEEQIQMLCPSIPGSSRPLFTLWHNGASGLHAVCSNMSYVGTNSGWEMFSLMHRHCIADCVAPSLTLLYRTRHILTVGYGMLKSMTPNRNLFAYEY